MSVNTGVLLPTREQVLNERDEAHTLIRLADKADAVGFDSVWGLESRTPAP